MIISFEVTNFRSIKTNQIFSLEASTSQAKNEHVFEILLSNGEKLRLLKLAGIYGANGSGKSTVIRAFKALLELITRSEYIKINQPLPAYEPFLFDTETQNAPVKFRIEFFGLTPAPTTQAQHIYEKYAYEIEFTGEEIIEEKLDLFTNKKRTKNILLRNNAYPQDNDTHIGKVGNKKYDVHKKTPLFAIFSQSIHYHPVVSGIYTMFANMNVYDSLDTNRENSEKIALNFYAQEQLKQKITHLLQQADTQIQDLRIETDAVRKQQLYAAHSMFEQGTKRTDFYLLSFKEESAGTQNLFLLFGLILDVFERGGVIFFDEIDTSLHPHLSRSLLYLFRNETFNPKNAQLVFTSHEVHLMDKNTMRADQIYFTEKQKTGETDLFSVQDFEGIRENIAFDEWYLAGKFGALPNIKYIK
jgi:AAA15 family ATPase/GTPase